MKPLSELPAAGVRALLFDLDGTLVDERLSPAAYAALVQAQQAGLRFRPLKAEHYDFAVPRARWERAGVVALRRVLEAGSPTRRELERLGFASD